MSSVKPFFPILILIITINSFSGSESSLSGNLAMLNKATRRSILDPTTLNSSELIRKYGRHCEEFDVITEDGYILKMFHITGSRSSGLSVLLLHGLMDSSDAFLVRGKTSLAIHLAESGYDVWLGNFRGNKYSRRHTSLDPDVDKRFWDFSFHENGYYDNPALIDFVLEKTGKSQVIIVTHSVGAMSQFITGATRPEYNAKIRVFFGMSPMCFCRHFRGLSAMGRIALPVLYEALTTLGLVELPSSNDVVRRLLLELCTRQRELGYALCAGAIFSLLGYDPTELEPEFLPVVLRQYFAGMSVKTLGHLGQITNNNFSWFDYGSLENMERYNSSVAPVYDVSSFKSKVVLMVGRNDFVGTVRDSVDLKNSLLNVTYFELPYERFNHVDFNWGKHLTVNLFPYFYKFLNKYK